MSVELMRSGQRACLLSCASALPHFLPCSDTFLGLWETGPHGGNQEARAKAVVAAGVTAAAPAAACASPGCLM